MQRQQIGRYWISFYFSTSRWVFFVFFISFSSLFVRFFSRAMKRITHHNDWNSEMHIVHYSWLTLLQYSLLAIWTSAISIDKCEPLNCSHVSVCRRLWLCETKLASDCQFSTITFSSCILLLLFVFCSPQSCTLDLTFHNTLFYRICFSTTFIFCVHFVAYFRFAVTHFVSFRVHIFFAKTALSATVWPFSVVIVVWHRKQRTTDNKKW